MTKFVLANIICAAAATTATVVAPITIAATTHPHLKTLNDYSWEEIKEISESGRASEMFNIGDEKDVMVNGIKHTVRIIDFDHDEIWNGEGKKAGITFEFKNVISQLGYKGKIRPMTVVWDGIYQEEDSGSNTNYSISTLNAFLDETTQEVDSIMNIIPEDLANVIKPVEKKVGVRHQGTETEPTHFDLEGFEARLFCLSDDEIYKIPSQHYSVLNEGRLYRYYFIHDQYEDAMKQVPGDEDIYWQYWLRSPSILNNNSYFAYSVSDQDGYWVNSLVWNVKFGVAPAFCI